MVVAIVALVIACAGTAAAATGVLITSSSQVRNGSITSADLADGRGAALRDFTPSTLHALETMAGPQGAVGPPGATGDRGPAGARGEQGPTGQPGADGSAIAWAYVTAAGGLGDSTAVNGIQHTPGSGIYCFDLTRPVRNAVASVDGGDAGTGYNEVIYPILPTTPSGQNYLLTPTASGGLGCDAAHADAGVVVRPLNLSSFADRAFWIAFN
jgi:hypothetical protein